MPYPIRHKASFRSAGRTLFGSDKEYEPMPEFLHELELPFLGKFLDKPTWRA